MSEICQIPECGQGFPNKQELKQHLETYHGDMNQLQCRECGKVLSSKQNLREHLFTHTGEKPYTCEECGMSFRQGSQLSSHKRIHQAFRGNSKQDEIAPIKVMFRQLTDMLQRFRPPPQVPIVEEKLERIELPPIVGSTSYSHLPPAQFD